MPNLPPPAPASFESLCPPIWRASTVLFPDAHSFLNRKERFFDGYTYGLAGTPTHAALAARLAELEQARHCVLSPSGLAAVSLVNHAVLRAGDHLLCCKSAYGPTQENAREVMGKLGVEVEFFDVAEGAEVARRLRPDTRLLWLEVPGSIRMQMADTRAIAQTARRAGVLVALDNTWATPLGFRPLAHGADFSVQALTKFAGGHSDVLMGGICVDDEKLFRGLKTLSNLLGNNVSPDDCALVSRGLDTLGLRLRRHAATTLEAAGWLAAQPQVRTVHCPALPADPGHALWQRDFTTAGSLCAFELRRAGWPATARFLDGLRVFRIGASWGGAHSLAAVYRHGEPDSFIIRLHFGLEEPSALIADLAQALQHQESYAC